jgi:hypothetical protein
MRKRNWQQYNKALVQRGSLTFLIDPKHLKSLFPKKQKKRGRPLEFTNGLIELLLTIKIHYKLTYRALEGFSRSLFILMKSFVRVPTYSLTCKRAKTLHHHLPKLSNRRPSTIIVDATGIKVLGEGEWKVKIHGKGRPRKWIKLHVAIDANTQEIIGEVSTDASVRDGTVFFPVFEQIQHRVRTVIGDGSYDGRAIRQAIKQQRGRALVPPPKHAVCSGEDSDRDRAIRDIRALGGDLVAKSIWGKFTGYSRRALVETTFSRYKKLFGERAFSRTRERQVIENRLKCVLLNKMIRTTA